MILSNLPPKLTLSRTTVTTRVTHHTPKRGTLDATHGRDSAMRVRDNFFGNFAANAPLYTHVIGDSRRSGSCDVLTSGVHPNRTSCTKRIHCRNFGSCHNNNRFSNELATPLIFTNTITGRTLTRCNVIINSRVLRVGSVGRRHFAPVNMDSRRLTTLRTGGFTIVSSTINTGVRRHVLRTGDRLGDINNMVRTVTLRLPTNVKTPCFSSIRDVLDRTLFSIPTIGKMRFNSNFNFTKLANTRTGSTLRCTSNGIRTLAGRGNNVANNVAGNVPLMIHITVGPAPSVTHRRRAIDLGRRTSAALTVINERSPYVMRHTIPIVRTIIT